MLFLTADNEFVGEEDTLTVEEVRRSAAPPPPCAAVPPPPPLPRRRRGGRCFRLRTARASLSTAAPAARRCARTRTA